MTILPSSSYFKRNLLLAIVYALTGMAGMQLAVSPGYATAVFPAAGIALALVLIGGRQMLPGVWLGSFLLNVWIAFAHGGIDARSVLIALLIGGGAATHAATGAWLVRKLLGDRWQLLDQEGDVIRFLLLIGPLASLVSACLGNGILLASGALTAQSVLFNWWNWWVGDTIGALIFTPLTLMLLLHGNPLWRERLTKAGIPTLAAASAIVVLFLYTSASEHKLLASRIALESNAIQQKIQTDVGIEKEAIRAIGRTIALMPGLGAEAFRQLVTPVLAEHPDLQALSWNPVVSDRDRARFEATLATQHGAPGLSITERDANLKLQPAGRRQEYVSVQYIAPLAGNLPALGYDIASDAVRRQAIERATATGQAAATAPISLVQNQKSETISGVLYLVPVYANNAQPGSRPLGFSVGVLNIHNIAQHTLLNHNPAGLNLALADVTQGGTPMPLFDVANNTSALRWTGDFEVGGRTWRLTVNPTSTYLENQRSLLAWAVLAVGLLMASLLQAMLLIMTGRESLIERTVQEKTAALAANQARLRESEELWRFALEGAGDGVWDVDVANGTSHYSTRWKSMLGYDENEIGNHFEDWMNLIHPEDLPRVMAVVNAYSEGREALYMCEYRLRCKDGSYKWILARGMAVSRTPEGKPLRMVGTHSDITLRHDAEEAMREARVTAEANARARSEFLANMSHEIRTPMNGIIGLSQLALNQQTSGEVRDYLQKISASSQSLLGILNDILDFSKLEAGRMVIEQNRFDLDTVLDNLRNLFEERAQARHLDFRIEIGNDVPRELMGDAMRLQQVLINLLGNAIKFTSSGHVTLRVQHSPAAAGHAGLHFAVEDTGIGISEEDRARLFQPFSQVDGSITRRFGGTGLGLAISQTLVELMGGHFDVASQSGLGSTFSFGLTLPLAEQSLSTQRKRRTVQVAGNLSDKLQSLAENLHDAHILLAEDNPINQQVVREFLTLSGMRVSVANDGQEALQLLAGEKFDAVLMDAHMPVMDGFEATRRIRADQSLAALPVIALTAGVTREDRERCMDSGMNDFVAKPVSPEILIDALTRWIRPGPAGNSGLKVPADDARTILLVDDNAAKLHELAAMLKQHYHVKLATNGRMALEIARREPHPDLILLDSDLPEVDGYEVCRELDADAATRQIPVLLILADGIIGSPAMAEKIGVAGLIESNASRQEITDTIQRLLHPPTPGTAP